MSHRFFKTSREVYDGARASLDAVFGHPNGRAETCLPPEPVTHEGNIFVALSSEIADWPEVAPMIDDLITSGAVEEIDKETYFSAIPDHVI